MANIQGREDKRVLERPNLLKGSGHTVFHLLREYDSGIGPFIVQLMFMRCLLCDRPHE
jgi:hypothetical protein